MSEWKNELTKNLKYSYARIVDPKNNNIPVNMLAKLSSPDFKNLVAYIVQVTSVRAKIKKQAQLILGLIRDWFIKCNNSDLQNWKNKQNNTEDVYMWWPKYPPADYNTYYDWFFSGNPSST